MTKILRSNLVHIQQDYLTYYSIGATHMGTPHRIQSIMTICTCRTIYHRWHSYVWLIPYNEISRSNGFTRATYLRYAHVMNTTCHTLHRRVPFICAINAIHRHGLYSGIHTCDSFAQSARNGYTKWYKHRNEVHTFTRAWLYVIHMHITCAHNMETNSF